MSAAVKLEDFEMTTLDDVDVELARKDPNCFVEYVLRDEETGGQLRQQPFHEEWQQILSDHKRAVIWSHFEGGKSTQISIGRVLWEIGHSASLRIVIGSNNQTLTKKIVRACARLIVSERYKRVFPHVRPSEPWNTTQLTVERETGGDPKDPTIEATSAHAYISGSRIDILILDDVLDMANCRTAEQRKQLKDWAKSTLFGRLSKRGRLWIIGNAWYPDDLMHAEAEKAGTFSKKFPVVDAETNEILWPSRWPKERVAQVYEDLGPFEFARKMKCVARDDLTARFKREWIQRCLDRGRNKALVHQLRVVPMGYRVYTGVDLASSKRKGSDDCAFFTFAVHPDGTRELLMIESGKMHGKEIVDKIVDTHERYRSIVFVESNSSQVFIKQFVEVLSAVPVHAFYTTGQNKPDLDFGVESIAAEMANGKWILPCDAAGKPMGEVKLFVEEMLNYAPSAHTGDRLMACWIGREGSRNNKPPKRMQSHIISLQDRR